MRLGCCSSIKNINLLFEAKCDYIEASLAEVSTLNESSFIELKEQMYKAPVKIECFNGMLTRDFNLIGDSINEVNVLKYLRRSFHRASQLGGKIIVFGSGYARNIPEGFSIDKAQEQLTDFLKMASDIASEYDLTIVIEPLRKEETNYINYSTDAKYISLLVHRDNVKILVDYFHFYNLNEPLTNLVFCADEIKHVHIANPITRGFPALNDGFDYSDFLNMLGKIGYDSRISVEAMTNDIVNDFMKYKELLCKYVK